MRLRAGLPEKIPNCSATEFDDAGGNDAEDSGLRT
jgi:hypothetical protein